MQILVRLNDSTGAVTVRVDRPRPGLPTRHLAQALESALTAAFIRAEAQAQAGYAVGGEAAVTSAEPESAAQPAAAQPHQLPGQLPRDGGAEDDPGEHRTDQGRQADTQRAAALQLLDDGVPAGQVCARLGVSPGQLYRWDNYRPDNGDRVATVLDAAGAR